MTNGDIVRRLSDVGLASLLSSIKHSADYESDDYDPVVLEWCRLMLSRAWCLCPRLRV